MLFKIQSESPNENEQVKTTFAWTKDVADAVCRDYIDRGLINVLPVPHEPDEKAGPNVGLWMDYGGFVLGTFEPFSVCIKASSYPDLQMGFSHAHVFHLLDAVEKAINKYKDKSFVKIHAHWICLALPTPMAHELFDYLTANGKQIDSIAEQQFAVWKEKHGQK